MAKLGNVAHIADPFRKKDQALEIVKALQRLESEISGLKKQTSVLFGSTGTDINAALNAHIASTTNVHGIDSTQRVLYDVQRKFIATSTTVTIPADYEIDVWDEMHVRAGAELVIEAGGELHVDGTAFGLVAGEGAMSIVRFTEVAPGTVSTPSSGDHRIFTDSTDSIVKVKKSNGDIIPLENADVVTSLPAVGTQAGKFMLLRTGAGTESILYVSAQFSDDTWDWLEIARTG